MRQVVALLLAYAFLVAGTGPLLAHGPDVTQAEQIRLPNGDTVKAWLLVGDGILGPDPVRALILDPNGHLLARSRKTYAIGLSCRADGDCAIFDLTHGTILEPDASSFRPGDRALSLEDRNGLWDLEGGDEAWGFRARAIAPGERSAYLRALVREHLSMMVFNAVAGGFCWLLATGAWIVVRTERTRTLQTVLAIVAILLFVAFGLYAVAVTFLFSAISALPPTMWMISLVSGGMVAVIGLCAVKRLRNASAAANGARP